jgi:hypothetical protein
MSITHDPQSIIAAWLDEGPMELPSETRRAIVVGMRTTTQRRSGLGWLGERRFPMFSSSAMRVSMGVGALALAGVIGFALWGGATPPIPPAAISPSATPAEPAETVVPAPSTPSPDPTSAKTDPPPLATPTGSPSAGASPLIANCMVGQMTTPPAASWPGWSVIGAMISVGHDDVAIQAFDGGLVAMPTPWWCPDGVSGTSYWLSTDGRSWEALELAGAFRDDVLIQSLHTASDGHLVAVGNIVGIVDDPTEPWELEPAAWRTDDGRTWERLEGWDLPTQSVVTNEDGGLLISRDPWASASQMSVWGSGDGYTWEEREVTLPRGFSFSHVGGAAGDTGFALIACTDHPAPDSEECRTLASADGRTWTTSDPLPGSWQSLVWFEGSWRAASWNRPAPDSNIISIWESSDAIEWRPLGEVPVEKLITRGDGSTTTGASFLAAGPRLVLSVADQLSGLRAWTSNDGGATWEQDGPMVNNLLSSAEYGGVVVLAGTVGDGPIVFWARDD